MLKSKITPEQAQALLDKHDLNMIKKVADGKPLSRQEQTELRALAGKKNAQARTEPESPEKTRKMERDYEKALRRRRVFELRLMGRTIREMAAELNVDKGTIMRDMRDLDAEAMGLINPREAQRLMNESLRNFDMIIQRATAEMEKATTENGRAAFINAIDRATMNRVKLMQELGLVDVAPIRVETSGPGGTPQEVTVTMDRPAPDEDMISLLKQWQAEQNKASTS